MSAAHADPIETIEVPFAHARAHAAKVEVTHRDLFGLKLEDMTPAAFKKTLA
jgi:hypothetical protein